MDADNFKPRQVLAQNLKGLMETKHGPQTQTDLSTRAGVAQSTIGRILNCEVAATIETVSDLAGAYGLQAWQLMVAGMNPSNPPVLMPVSAQEKALYERLLNAAREIASLEPARYDVKPK